MGRILHFRLLSKHWINNFIAAASSSNDENIVTTWVQAGYRILHFWAPSSIQKFIYRYHRLPIKRGKKYPMNSYFHILCDNIIWKENSIQWILGSKNFDIFDSKKCWKTKKSLEIGGLSSVRKNNMWKNQKAKYLYMKNISQEHITRRLIIHLDVVNFLCFTQYCQYWHNNSQANKYRVGLSREPRKSFRIRSK